MVNDGSIRTCSSPQSVSAACEKFMRVTTARPIRPLGFRTWFVMRTMYTITIKTRTVLITGHSIVPLPLPRAATRGAPRPIRARGAPPPASERDRDEDLRVDHVARAEPVVQVQVALVHHAGAGHAAAPPALIERAGTTTQRVLVVVAVADEVPAVERARIGLDALHLPQHVVGARAQLVDARVADQPALEIHAHVEAVGEVVAGADAQEQVVGVERVPPSQRPGHSLVALREHARGLDRRRR